MSRLGRMIPRSRRGRLTAALAAVLVAGAVAAGITGYQKVHSPIRFPGAYMSGMDVHPGQSESFAAIANAEPAGYSYRITKVSLIPLPGFREPTLVGAVILIIRGFPFQAPGFPPRRDNGTPYRVHAIGAYTARSGPRPHRPQVVVMYGLRGDHLGGYAVAGIRITYTVGGNTYTANIHEGADLFYYPRGQTRTAYRRSQAAYDKYDNRAGSTLQKMLS